MHNCIGIKALKWIASCSLLLSLQVSATEKIQSLEDSLALGHPWSAFGGIADSMLGNFCTGVLVHNRIVLTAAHCVIRSGSYGSNSSLLTASAPENLFFFANLHDIETELRIYRVKIAVKEVILPSSEPPFEGVNDWAFLILAESAPSDIFPLSIREFSAQDAMEIQRDKVKNDFTLAGFPSNQVDPFNLHLAEGCQTLDSSDLLKAKWASKIIALNCAMGAGASGGALLLQKDDESWELVGTYFGRHTQVNGLGFAVPSTEYLKKYQSLLQRVDVGD